MSAKELKQVADDKQALTAHFIQTLPPLLKKYLPDHEKIANLMVIPQHFDLEIYTTSRQEKNLETLLNLIQEIVDKHSDTEVLEACAKVRKIHFFREIKVNIVHVNFTKKYYTYLIDYYCFTIFFRPWKFCVMTNLPFIPDVTLLGANCAI